MAPDEIIAHVNSFFDELEKAESRVYFAHKPDDPGEQAGKLWGIHLHYELSEVMAVIASWQDGSGGRKIDAEPFHGMILKYAQDALDKADPHNPSFLYRTVRIEGDSVAVIYWARFRPSNKPTLYKERLKKSFRSL